MGIGPRKGVGLLLGVEVGARHRYQLTSGDFTAYVCDATRPSSQITLGRLFEHGLVVVLADSESLLVWRQLSVSAFIEFGVRLCLLDD